MGESLLQSEEVCLKCLKYFKCHRQNLQQHGGSGLRAFPACWG